MSDTEDKFDLFSQLLAKICEIKLAYLISKEVKVEYLGKEDSKLDGKNLQLEKDAMLLSIPLEAVDSSLVIYSDLDQVAPIADIFAGGEGEVDAELSEAQKTAYVDTSTQVLTSMFKYLVFKDEKLQLQYGETKKQVVKGGLPEEIEMYGSLEAIAFKLKMIINGSKEIELTVNFDQNIYNDYIEKLEAVFENLNLDTIDEKLKKELNSSKFSEKNDFGVRTRNDDDDSLYVVDQSRNLSFIKDVNLDLIVELGRAELQFNDVLNLGKGSAIELDRHCSESVDLYVHNQLVAKGEVIAIDDNFGLKITEILGSINLFKDLSNLGAK